MDSHYQPALKFIYLYSLLYNSQKTFLFSSNSTLSILRSLLFIFPTIFRLKLALYAMFAHIYLYI